MFDVRPVNNAGGLDLEKIKKVEQASKIQKKKSVIKKVIPDGQGDLFEIRKYQKEVWETEKALRKKSLEKKQLEKKLQEDRSRLQAEINEARKGKNKIMQLGVLFDSNKVPMVYKIEKMPEIFTAKNVKKNQEEKIDPRINFWNNGQEKFQKNKNFAEKDNFFKEEYHEKFEPKTFFETSGESFSEKNGFLSEIDFWSEEDQRRESEFFAEKKHFSFKEFLSELREKLPRFKMPAWLELSSFSETGIILQPQKNFFSFATVSIFIFLIIFGTGFIGKGLEVKQSVLGTSQTAYANLSQAKEEIMKNNFQGSSFRFTEAYDNFDNISKELDSLGSIFVNNSRFLPYISKLSSGKYLAEAGKNISRIGILSGEIMKVMEQVKNPLENTKENNDAISFLKIFQDTSKNSQEILELLEKTENDLDKVNVDDIPEDKRSQFVELKNKLPEIKSFIRGFLDNSQIFTDILGGNGPRKYLFLFQNNQEMRATGGFIGSYGVMNIFNGRINKFFIDGIFNPDGQLREKVVPPTPIQKISAAWSLHDSNWFPDFPVSAEKAIWFYGKTGGPTVDGIITMTPNVMVKLLEISGPIEMPEYDVTINKDNFLEEVQNEVEVEYDKELNQPKKILADLAPKILDAIFNSKKISNVIKTLDVLAESLNEKQMLLYSRNYEIEKKISEENWSGEVLSTDKDYLSIINSNINGFKTDGVIDETIEHKAEIREDGSIVDSVTITRKHNGGDMEFDWLNKVNANYMRVYVPKGSQLISAEGQTREFNSPPLDYKALNFKHDSQVQAEEESIKIDTESGTKVYEDAGKTVFANWAYVSPKEEVVIKYSYLLPFKISMNDSNKPADTYSLLVQKQSGSLGSKFISNIIYPQSYNLIWRYPENISDENESGRELKTKTSLEKDKFMGAVFSKIFPEK